MKKEKMTVLMSDSLKPRLDISDLYNLESNSSSDVILCMIETDTGERYVSNLSQMKRTIDPNEIMVEFFCNSTATSDIAFSDIVSFEMSQDGTQIAAIERGIKCSSTFIKDVGNGLYSIQLVFPLEQ